MVFSGRIDNSNHPLGAGMEVDVLNLNGLLVTSPMTVEGLDRAVRRRCERNRPSRFGPADIAA
jgi:hypothetical protein